MIFPVADLPEFAVIASSHQVYQQSGKPDDKTRCDRNKQTQKDKQESSPDRRVDGKDIEISRQINVDLAALAIDDRISDPVILPPGQKPYRQIDRLFIAILCLQEFLQIFRLFRQIKAHAAELVFQRVDRQLAGLLQNLLFIESGIHVWRIGIHAGQIARMIVLDIALCERCDVFGNRIIKIS